MPDFDAIEKYIAVESIVRKREIVSKKQFFSFFHNVLYGTYFSF